VAAAPLVNRPATTPATTAPDKKSARAPAGEIPDLIEQVARLPMLEPGGGPVDALGRLPCDLSGHARLAALRCHLMNLVGERVQLAGRLVLL